MKSPFVFMFVADWLKIKNKGLKTMMNTERYLIKKSFPKLSEQDIKNIFKMYPNKSQSDSRMTIAHVRHLELEERYG